MKKSFTIVVERDPESQWLVGEVVELPGCYTQAPNVSKLRDNMWDAICVYLGATSTDELQLHIEEK